MDIKIYQTYFDQSQLGVLDPSFIPFDNTSNEQPLLREYPLLKKLHEQNANFDGYWGMTSWRWYEKTKLSGAQFISWVQDNPGYDLYHVNHYPKYRDKNIFWQGEHCHGGMLDCLRRIITILGYNNFDFDVKYPREYFITCHYYVATNAVWDRLIDFFNKCVEVSNQDKQVYEYMHVGKTRHRSEHIINFSFVMERLPALYLLLHQDIRIKEYPPIATNDNIPRALR
jgi:hypothetical protein